MITSFNSLLQTKVLYQAAFFNIGQGASATLSTRQLALEPSVAGVDRAMSWSVWIKPSNYPSNGAQRVFQSAEPTTNNIQYVMQLTGVDAATTVDNQKIRFIVFTNASNFIYIQSQNKILRNRWTHIVITYDGSEANTGFEMYINGVLDGSPTRSGLGTYTGAWNDADFRFQLSRESDVIPPAAKTRYTGYQKDVAIWNKELNQTEVTELYNLGRPLDVNTVSFYADIEAYWPLRSDLTALNSATFNLTDTGDVGSLTFRSTPISVTHKPLTIYQIQPGNTRYVAFGGLFHVTGTTAYWNGRSGTSHVLNGKLIKYAIDYSTGIAGSPVDIKTDANDLRGGSAGIIGSKIMNFTATYVGGTDTFVDLVRFESTDGLTGETFGSAVSMSTNLDRFIFYGKVVSGFSAGHYFVPEYEGSTGGASREINVYKTEDDGATWNKITVWTKPSGSFNLQEPALINLGNIGGNNTLLMLCRSADNGLYQIVSTDGGATWGAPAVTNLISPAGLSCADMALDDQGRLHVIYMNRGDNSLYISTKNYVADILSSATAYTTPAAIVSSYTSDSLGILGYPNIIFVGGRKALITFSLEFSSSRADLFMGVGTFYDNS